MCSIALTATCVNPVKALGLPIDEDKILFDYKKRFNKIVSSNIFSTPAELRSNKALRDSIFDYINSQGTSVTSPADTERLWAQYILSKFGSRKAFDTKLKEGYLSEADVKARFKDNLTLLKYFKESVEPKIQADLSKRAEILEYADSHDIRYNSEALKHEFFNTVESYGGQKRFEKYLRDNYLSIADVFYFIKSDFISPIIKEDLFEAKLKNDPAYKDSFEKEIKEYYQNHKESKFHIEDKYYFSELFIPKGIAKDAEIKSAMTKLLADVNAGKPIPELLRLYGSTQYYKLQAPLTKNSKLYSDMIKNALIGQAPAYISPVLENKLGFYILSIDRIEQGRYLSFEEARDQAYNAVKAQKLKYMEVPVIGQL